MADTKISALTDGTTAVATDRIPVARSPFGATDNRYLTPPYIKDYILGLANTFTRGQTITQGTANEAILASTGFSLTGANAQSFIDLTGTWNTTGLPSAILLNLTDTASDGGSLLINLKVGGTSVFKVGKSGNTTVRDLIATQNVKSADQAGGSGYLASNGLGWFGLGGMEAQSDGVVTLFDNAATGFGRLQFGGESSSFPALKRSSAIIQARLADDSDYAILDCDALRVNGTKVVGDQGAAVADASGGAVIDAEARTALNALLARARVHGLIAT